MICSMQEAAAIQLRLCRNHTEFVGIESGVMRCSPLLVCLQATRHLVRSVQQDVKDKDSYISQISCISFDLSLFHLLVYFIY